MSELTTSARDNFATCIALLVLTTITVIARFSTRVSLRQRPSAPDWLCLLALVCFYGYCITIINFIFNVSHAHAFDANPNLGLAELRNLLLTSFILEIFLSLVITSVKFSILWLYHTLFGISTLAKRLIYGTGIACALWFVIAIFVLIIFQCHPVDAYWNEFMSPAACLDARRLLLGYELTNLFIDVVILCIPIVVIGKLQLSQPKKIGASVVFLLGIFVCISSVVRLTTIYDAQNPSRPVLFSPSIIWSTLQVGFAIICSCLPVLGPLFGRIIGNSPTMSKRQSYPHSRSAIGNPGSSSRPKLKGTAVITSMITPGPNLEADYTRGTRRSTRVTIILYSRCQQRGSL
ncbi:hypothetical protein F4808DRAFT_431530 [Astrocystis sublimbata]|nr:hypothetical protein F4808DRAFT_431530 [Astrocystis sublimbata]